jgi:hypothetical protein
MDPKSTVLLKNHDTHCLYTFTFSVLVLVSPGRLDRTFVEKSAVVSTAAVVGASCHHSAQVEAVNI